MGGIPGFGSVSGSLRGYGSGGIVASFAEAARNSWDQAQQGELDKAAVKSVLPVAGYATGIPAAQIKKTLDAIEAARDGEDMSVLDYLTGPPRACHPNPRRPEARAHGLARKTGGSGKRVSDPVTEGGRRSH